MMIMKKMRRWKTTRTRNRTSRDSSTLWVSCQFSLIMKSSTSTFISFATKINTPRTHSLFKLAQHFSKELLLKRSRLGSSSKFRPFLSWVSSRQRIKRITLWWKASMRRWLFHRMKEFWKAILWSWTRSSTKLLPNSLNYSRKIRCLELRYYSGSHPEKLRIRSCWITREVFRDHKLQTLLTRRNRRKINLKMRVLLILITLIMLVTL